MNSELPLFKKEVSAFFATRLKAEYQRVQQALLKAVEEAEQANLSIFFHAD